MGLKYFLSLFLLLGLALGEALGQTDREFWFAAPDITATHGDDPIQIRLSTFDRPSNITISQPANPGFAPQLISLAANSAQTIDLTAFLADIEAPANTVSNAGILIESTELITAYYEVNPRLNPDIFALKGRNGLGTEFRLPMQQTWASNPYTIEPTGGAVIVATEDNTNVTITPTTDITIGGTVIHPAGTPFTVNLDLGQVYSLNTESTTGADLPAGTLIESDKPVAVTLFHDSIKVGGCHDLTGDQLVPTDILGTDYIVMRGFFGGSYDEIINVTAVSNGTQVFVDGTLQATINAGESYRHPMTTTDVRAYVTTSQPAYVTHYAGFGCEVGMAILPPIECTGSREVYFVRSTDERFGLNLLVPAGSEDNFSLNGRPENTDIPASAFAVVPGTGGAWMSAQIEVSDIPALNALITSGNTAQVANSDALFHLGVINGGNSGSGCRYGYFSSFSTVNLGPDINVNYGTTVTLDAGTLFGISYLWNTGETTQTIDVDIWNYGDYWVEVDLGTCTLRDTVCVGTVEYVWRGQVSEDYGDPDNWSKSCQVVDIPDCDDDVIIPGTASSATVVNYPRVDAAYEARTLYLEAGAQFNATPTGSFRLCGDFLHQGTIGFVDDAEFIFGGTRPQTYSRTGAAASGAFAVLRIDNGTPATAFNSWPHVTVKDTSDHLQVRQRLRFDQGILLTEADREVVVQSDNPAAVSGHDPSRFVAGRIRREIQPTGSYDFPVGLAESQPDDFPVVAGRTATLINADTTTAWVATPVCGGKTGIQLAGTNVAKEYVELPTTIAFAGAAPRTVEIWAKVDNFNSAGLFQLGTPGNTREDFSLRTRGSDDDWRLQFWGTDLDVNLPDSKGQWHHYALVYDGTQAKIYYDGVLYGTLTVALNTVVTATELYLGRWRNNYLEGTLAEFKVWNKALSSAEVNASMCQSYDCSNLPPTELIAYYDFREGSGEQIATRGVDCPAPSLSYQLANVNFTSATTSDNLMAYFERYATVPGPTGQTDICAADFDTHDALNNGKWRIDAFNGSTPTSGDGTYTMTLYPRDYTNAQTQATVMKRDPIAATPWQIPTGFCVDDAVGSPARGGMSGFSEFGIAQTTDLILLPVQLTDLRATPETDFIMVRWQTSEEENNLGFEVERSTDGVHFTTLGFVPLGGAAGEQNYRFPDYEARPGIRYYYRLRQLDEDGSSSLSRIVTARLAGGTSLDLIRVFPNPTDDLLSLDLSALQLEATELHYQLTNMVGNRVQSGTLSLASSQHQLRLGTLPQGVYLLSLTDGKRQRIVKVTRW